MALAPLCRISVTPSVTHNQIGPLWCWFPSWWVCARSRPLWISPTTSSVRLGVSPAAASTSTGVFTQRFEALFPPRWSPGLRRLLRSPLFVLVYLCASVGPQCATRALPAPFSATLSPALWAYLRECGTAGSACARTACPGRPTLCQSRSTTAM